jgi:hypothetical protein
MSLDSDVALLGTGVAPLVAASHLLAQGKSVLLLNPDWDFFLEDSELPLDPFLKQAPTVKSIQNNSPEHALATLRPDFPGPIEFWSATADRDGYYDPTAPHVRQRGRLWISSLERDRLWNWGSLEDLYVEASDAGMNPLILDGIAATRRFPGLSSHHGTFRGLYIPKFYDVDVTRYRNGLLEFVRERLGPERMIRAISQVERMPEGIRFYSKDSSHTARIKEGLLVFWTPRLSPWIFHQAKKTEVRPKLPQGVRLWEQWILNSREAPDPSTVGMFGDMAVWADIEGAPTRTITPRLSVLRAGPLVTLEEMTHPKIGMTWASADSFRALSMLCNDFLKWDRFSVRAMKARAIFEWDKPTPWMLAEANPWVRVIPACDGPLVRVVQTARSSLE